MHSFISDDLSVVVILVSAFGIVGGEPEKLVAFSVIANCDRAQCFLAFMHGSTCLEVALWTLQAPIWEVVTINHNCVGTCSCSLLLH